MRKPAAKVLFRRWVAGCVAHVLHRSARLKMRKFRNVLTQDGGTVDPKNERGETATVNPVRVTGTSPGRTDANDECPSQKCTASEHWRPGVSSSPYKCAREREEVGVEADDGSQEEVRLKVFHPKEECDVLAAQTTREFHRDACQNVERSSAVWFRPRRCNALTRLLGQEVQTV